MNISVDRKKEKHPTLKMEDIAIRLPHMHLFNKKEIQETAVTALQSWVDAHFFRAPNAKKVVFLFMMQSLLSIVELFELVQSPWHNLYTATVEYRTCSISPLIIN
jgi:hypothetical protein